MSDAVRRAFGDITRRLKIVLIAAAKREQLASRSPVIDADRAALYVLAMGRTERLLTRLFGASNRDVERLAHFTAIAAKRGDDRTLANVLMLLVDDVDIVVGDFVPIARSRMYKTDVDDRGLDFLVGAYWGGGEDSGVDTFQREIASAISTGLAESSIRVLQRYAHNVHLPAQILRSPADFLPSGLLSLRDAKGRRRLFLQQEQNPHSVTSMTDTTIRVIVEVKAKLGGEPVLLRETEIHVTFDSKVCFNVETFLKSRTSRQQFQLLMGDRWKLLNDLMNDLNHHKPSEPDKEAFLAEMVPAIFGHYVFAPGDFRDPGNRIGNRYKADFLKWLPIFSEVQLDAGATRMTFADYDRCINAISTHIDSHFGSGAFLNRKSRLMLYGLVED